MQADCITWYLPIAEPQLICSELPFQASKIGKATRLGNESHAEHT